jgi:hypothetical protein
MDVLPKHWKEDLLLEEMDNLLLESGRLMVALCMILPTTMDIITEWRGSALEVPNHRNFSGLTPPTSDLAHSESLFMSKSNTRLKSLLITPNVQRETLLSATIQTGLVAPTNALKLLNVNSSFMTLMTVNVFKNLPYLEIATLATEWKAHTTCSTGTRKRLLCLK